MNPRTTLVLLTLTAGLGAYLYFVEAKSKSSDELAEQRNRIAPDFARDRASDIAIVREGKTMRLQEENDAWRIVAPIDTPADGGAVEALLSSLEFLEVQRRIDDPDARKRADYGLDKPQATVSVKGAGILTLTLGTADATGKSVYVARGDEPTVFVVENHFLETVSKPLDDWRDKRVFGFERTKLRTVSVASASSRVRLGKTSTGSQWLLLEPTKMLAASERVDAMMGKLEEVKATRFIADGAADLSTWGLDAPVTTIEFDDGQPKSVVLGGACGEHAGERYAARKGNGQTSTVFCVAENALHEVVLDGAAMREMHLFGAPEADILRVKIEAGGGHVVLERESGGWWITAPSRQQADDDLVRKWLDDLRAYRAAQWVETSAALEKPARVTLEITGGEKLVLAFGARDRGMVSVRRNDEPGMLQIHEEATQHLRADTLTFRSRKVLSFSRVDVTRVEAKAGPVIEEAEKKDGMWKLAKPAGVAIDEETVDQVLGAMADLRVERFVAGAAGLGAPARDLMVTVEGSQEPEQDGEDQKEKKKETYTLALGADLAGQDAGCYGRSGGASEPVFVLASTTCRDLRALFATRKLFDLEEDKLVGFVIHRSDGTTELEKRGPDWHRAEGSAVDKERIDELVSLLRNVKARTALRYDTLGLGTPRTTVVVKTEAKPEQTLVLGSDREENGTVVGAYAKFGERNVTYVIEKSFVDEIARLRF